MSAHSDPTRYPYAQGPYYEPSLNASSGQRSNDPAGSTSDLFPPPDSDEDARDSPPLHLGYQRLKKRYQSGNFGAIAP